jgi:hypothetical protein
VFQLLYPQASPAASSGSSVPPDGCFIPDISGCYDFQSCIAPGFNSSQYPHLVQPDCSDTMNKCKYPCKCAVSTAAELRDADFSISRFLFFSPKVPIVQAVLGSAFLLCLLATVTLRQTRSPSDMFVPSSLLIILESLCAGTWLAQARVTTKSGCCTHIRQSARCRVLP